MPARFPCPAPADTALPRSRRAAPRRLALLAVLLVTAGAARADESVDGAVCRLIETAAAAHRLPPGTFTRLIWRESTFRADAASPAGAQGIAQFMPGTAADRGLKDPFDPETAIPASAHLLSDLRRHFGNLGLAAAAYNAGPNRLARVIAGHSVLPAETEDYVLAVTGRPAADWMADQRAPAFHAEPVEPPRDPQSCLPLVARLRQGAPPVLAAAVALSPLAPWGVQLAGNFSKSLALRSYARAQARYRVLLASLRPMVIGTRLRSRGSRPFYRVRAPAATRADALRLCAGLHRAGGACLVLRSR